MSAEVIPLKGRKPEPPPPTRAELVAKVHELAKDSGNIGFQSPHFKERLAQRGKTMRQVLEVLRKGEGVSGPKKDQYGDWRIKLMKVVARRRVQVVVAVREERIFAVTVI
jgi:hypothetical protein